MSPDYLIRLCGGSDLASMFHFIAGVCVCVPACVLVVSVCCGLLLCQFTNRLHVLGRLHMFGMQLPGTFSVFMLNWKCVHTQTRCNESL